MVPCTFNVKFPYDTQFTFVSLTVAAGKDGDLKMLGPNRKSFSSLFLGKSGCLCMTDIIYVRDPQEGD
jgi:hypothetical protein